MAALPCQLCLLFITSFFQLKPKKINGLFSVCASPVPAATTAAGGGRCCWRRACTLLGSSLLICSQPGFSSSCFAVKVKDWPDQPSSPCSGRAGEGGRQGRGSGEPAPWGGCCGPVQCQCRWGLWPSLAECFAPSRMGKHVTLWILCGQKHWFCPLPHLLGPSLPFPSCCRLRGRAEASCLKWSSGAEAGQVTPFAAAPDSLFAFKQQMLFVGLGLAGCSSTVGPGPPWQGGAAECPAAWLGASGHLMVLLPVPTSTAWAVLLMQCPGWHWP